MHTKILTHKQNFVEKHPILIDTLIIILLMALSIGLRLPTLSLPDKSYTSTLSSTDENGYPYLSDPDSYYFARRTREYAEESSILPHAIPDTAHINADGSTSSNFEFFPYLMSLFYRAAHNSFGLSFDVFIVFAGAFVFSLSIIPSYIFVKRRTGNRFGAIAAGVFTGLCPAFFVDTNISCYDSDIILFFLPVTAIALFIEALLSDSFKKYLAYLAGSLVTFIIFLYAWGTCDVYFYLMAGAFVVFFILKWLSLKKIKFTLKDHAIKRYALGLAVIFIAFFAIRGLSSFENIYNAARIVVGAEETSENSSDATADPNPGKYVSELGKATFINKKEDWFVLTNGTVISASGGIIVCLIAFLTIVTFAERSFADQAQKSSKTEYQILLAIFACWTIGTLISATMGVRFVKLFAIPIAIVAAIGLGYFYVYAKQHNFAGSYIYFAFLLIGIPYLGVTLSCKSFYASSSDNLVATSRYLKENAAETDSTDTSLIVTWWDDGYIFEYESGLRTLMDGGTYNGHFYHPVARMLLNNDYDDAVAEIKSFLAELNLHPTKLYIPVSSSYLGFSSALEYYANFNEDVILDSSSTECLLRRMIAKDEQIGDFHYLTKFGEYSIYELNL